MSNFNSCDTFFVKMCVKAEFQGLRSTKKRSLLGVNEHFEREHKVAIKPYAESVYTLCYGEATKRNLTQKIPFTLTTAKKMCVKAEFQGLRSTKKRSLPGVNELFEREHNAENTFYTHFSFFNSDIII